MTTLYYKCKLHFNLYIRTEMHKTKLICLRNNIKEICFSCGGNLYVGDLLRL